MVVHHEDTLVAHRAVVHLVSLQDAAVGASLYHHGWPLGAISGKSGDLLNRGFYKGYKVFSAQL